MNRLPTQQEWKDYLEALATARWYYRQRRFREGWEWVLVNKEKFPDEKLQEMFLKFASKILNIEK